MNELDAPVSTRIVDSRPSTGALIYDDCDVFCSGTQPSLCAPVIIFLNYYWLLLERNHVAFALDVDSIENHTEFFVGSDLVDIVVGSDLADIVVGSDLVDIVVGSDLVDIVVDSFAVGFDSIDMFVGSFVVDFDLIDMVVDSFVVAVDDLCTDNYFDGDSIVGYYYNKMKAQFFVLFWTTILIIIGSNSSIKIDGKLTSLLTTVGFDESIKNQ